MSSRDLRQARRIENAIDALVVRRQATSRSFAGKVIRGGCGLGTGASLHAAQRHRGAAAYPGHPASSRRLRRLISFSLRAEETPGNCVNAGEPIAEDDDLFGASVIVAARIAAKASGAQILVADVVRQLVAGKGFLFSDTGEHVLKGFEEPVRIWELRWGEPE